MQKGCDQDLSQYQTEFSIQEDSFIYKILLPVVNENNGDHSQQVLQVFKKWTLGKSLQWRDYPQTFCTVITMKTTPGNARFYSTMLKWHIRNFMQNTFLKSKNSSIKKVDLWGFVAAKKFCVKSGWLSNNHRPAKYFSQCSNNAWIELLGV